MKKTLKIIFCSLAIVTILTANVFASGWAGYTPNFADETSVLFTENITSAYSAETLGQVIDNAYNLGLFGGAVPFVVFTTPVEGAESFYGITVLCVSPFLTNGNQTSKSSVYGYIDLSYETPAVFASVGETLGNYLMLNTGDTYSVLGILGNTGYEVGDTDKILLIRSPEGEWFYDDNSSLFAQFYNVDATENEALANINAKYLNALEGYTPPSEPSEPSEPPAPPIIQNYLLDIPSIITAIPNGAKQIINNAFGFEIFGINVAGLLSVILIVTIISFIVKWLMSR